MLGFLLCMDTHQIPHCLYQIVTCKVVTGMTWSYLCTVTPAYFSMLMYLFAAVTVKIDAFVTSKSMYAKLLQVLRWCSKPNSKLRLAIKRLSLVSLGLHRVCHFLEMVDPQVTFSTFMFTGIYVCIICVFTGMCIQ